MKAVSIARCAELRPDEVGAAVTEAVAALGGMERFVQPGNRVLLKPNLLSPDPPERAVTTHPLFVQWVIELVLAAGGKPFLGDSPAWGALSQVAQVAGLKDVAARYGVPLVEFCRPVAVPSPRPQVARRVLVDAAVLEAEVVINLPKLKAHRQLGFCGAVKNLYGCLPGKRKALLHFLKSRRDLHFALFLANYHAAVAPALTIVDAGLALERTGPRGGDPRFLGLVVAGTDCAAVDTVLAEIIQAPPSHRLLLEAVRQLDLGVTDLEAIELRGEPLEAIRPDRFLLPDLIGVGFSLPRVVRSVVRNFFLTRAPRLRRRRR
ncbi:MAG TPA: DUF362 domain-containing protein [Armatimonadetes bacterium]|nr:DUF362 domain-containing protein [Armatimonadota bacterium]